MDGLFASAHPFGNLATTDRSALSADPTRSKAHGFASSPFDEFALSRMKGVAIQARREDLPPDEATKTGTPGCFETLGCDWGTSK